MGTIYRCTWTDDNQSFAYPFNLYVPTLYPGTFNSIFTSVISQTKADTCIPVLTELGSDAYYDNELIVYNDSGSLMPAGWGFNQTHIGLSSLAVSQMFVLSTGNYIKITAINGTSVTYTYYLNGTSIGSITRSIAASSDSYCYAYHIFPLPYSSLKTISRNGSVNTINNYYPNSAYYCYKNAYYGYSYQGTNGYVGVSSTLADGFDDMLATAVVVDTDDPYYQQMNDSAGSGGVSGGGGLPSSDSIAIPGLPTISVVDTGFVTLFNPTLSEVKSLAAYMWDSSLFDYSTYLKIFADPMDCILGFNLVPVTVPNGSSTAVKVGNITTTVNMTEASAQWVELDCGTLSLDEIWGSYLDYAPYTKAAIYLPYIGTQELSIDDIMGKSLHLVYHVDVLSCTCIAYLKCGDSVLYQFTGACGYSIPLTSENFRAAVSAVISIAAGVAGAVASGGATAPMIAATANTANNVMSLKPEVHRSGAVGASAGIMGIQIPYLILETPNPCKPKYQYKYLGYPSFVYETIDDIAGYAEFDKVLLDGIACTDDEKQMIRNYLEGGVYI